MFLLETPQKEHTQPNPQTMVLSPFFFRWLVCQPFFFFSILIFQPPATTSPRLQPTFLLCIASAAQITQSQRKVNQEQKQQASKATKGTVFVVLLGACTHTTSCIQCHPKIGGRATSQKNTKHQTQTTAPQQQQQQRAFVCLLLSFVCHLLLPSFFPFPHTATAHPFRLCFCCLLVGWFLVLNCANSKQSSIHTHTHAQPASSKQTAVFFCLLVRLVCSSGW